ncbi:putative peroxygenase 4 [Cinnamomum micranthum f. kanehirae]|uniref:Putative peroxygenase 4 n=1 Tax=Cinnamomum micranthum f. kanehirae TaxID=337451 RepID=A0A3S3M0W7_9MAGN|nr:putative peroxygenase 4 [Cinnamomum micranthum f. kanehirae]
MKMEILVFFSLLIVLVTVSLARTLEEVDPLQGIVDATLNGEMTALQKHVAFFDKDKDGIVYPSETYKGFRAIGCGLPLSTAASVLINLALSSKTLPEGQKAAPNFPIYIENINRAKHGSDTGVYDTQGRFVPEKFEDIFLKHAHSNPDSLTSDELDEMLKANRIPKDTTGSFTGWTEWKVLYSLGKDENGLLHKETVRAVFDGSLFEQLEKKASRRMN